MILFSLRALASLGLLLLLTWTYGEAVLRLWLPVERTWERRAIAIALGSGLMAQALFLLALVGLLRADVIAFVTAVSLALCHRTSRSLLRAPARPTSFRWGLALAALLALAPCFLLALYPATGFDATLYHLPFARHFLEAESLLFLPDLRVPVFPVMVEMLFSFALLLGGDPAAHLTQFVALLATAGLLYGWGRSRGGEPQGAFSAALWLGVPLVVWLGANAYIDLNLTLWVTAGLYSWQRWISSEAEPWLALSGLFMGLAAASKYQGLFFLALLLGLSALHAFRRRRFRELWVVSLVALVATAPTYLRILYHTGNPLFPFFPSIFGDTPWSIEAAAVYHQRAPLQGGGLAGFLEGVADRLLFLVTVPWNGVFDRQVFHLRPPLSPWYLLILPLLLPLALRSRAWRPFLLAGLIYAILWSFSFPELRYLVPLLPMLHLACFEELRRPFMADRLGRPRTLLLATSLLLLPGPLYATYKLIEYGPPPVTASERARFLDQELPGHAALTLLDREAAGEYTVYVLYGERLRYYADGRFIGDRFGLHPYRHVLAALDDGRRLFRVLQQAGATHLLVVQPRRRRALPTDAAFSERFERLVEEEGFALFRLRPPSPNVFSDSFESGALEAWSPAPD